MEFRIRRFSSTTATKNWITDVSSRRSNWLPGWQYPIRRFSSALNHCCVCAYWILKWVDCGGKRGEKKRRVGTFLSVFRCGTDCNSCCNIWCLVGIAKTECYVDFMNTLPPCTLLDYETRLYKGCGASELFSITLAVSCSWLPFALLIGYVILDGLHALFVAFAVFLAGTLLVVATVANIYKSLKQGKPEGWHTRKFYCAIHPIFSSNLVLKSGCWSTNREI